MTTENFNNLAANAELGPKVTSSDQLNAKDKPKGKQTMTTRSAKMLEPPTGPGDKTIGSTSTSSSNQPSAESSKTGDTHGAAEPPSNGQTSGAPMATGGAEACGEIGGRRGERGDTPGGLLALGKHWFFFDANKVILQSIP
jgi:hypothetical protein